jgi:hypothetical protein
MNKEQKYELCPMWRRFYGKPEDNAKKPAKSSKNNGQICPVLFHGTHRATRERTHLYTVYCML